MRTLISLLHAARGFWESSPGLHFPILFVWRLLAISGAFWLISWILGHTAMILRKALTEELWDLFVFCYNIILAVAFASVVALFISLSSAPAKAPLGLQAFGLAFAYFALAAAYTDPHSKEMHELSQPGWLAGLAAYLGFALFPKYLANPVTLKTHEAISLVIDGWVGAAMSALSAWRFVSKCVDWAKKTFTRATFLCL